MTGRTWVFAVVAAMLIVGLLAFARGPAHHRGPQVVGSSMARSPSAVADRPRTA